MDKNYKVACFGAGFVGLPTSSVLALNNPDIEVYYFLNIVRCLRHRRKEDRQVQRRTNAHLRTQFRRNHGQGAQEKPHILY